MKRSTVLYPAEHSAGGCMKNQYVQLSLSMGDQLELCVWWRSYS